MSDSFKGLMVILEEDHENGDREKFVAAIKMMKGVSDVQPIDSDGYHDILIKRRTLTTVKKAIDEVITNISEGKVKLII